MSPAAAGSREVFCCCAQAWRSVFGICTQQEGFSPLHADLKKLSLGSEYSREISHCCTDLEKLSPGSVCRGEISCCLTKIWRRCLWDLCAAWSSLTTTYRPGWKALSFSQPQPTWCGALHSCWMAPPSIKFSHLNKKQNKKNQVLFGLSYISWWSDVLNLYST